MILDRWTGANTPLHCSLAVSPDRPAPLRHHCDLVRWADGAGGAESGACPGPALSRRPRTRSGAASAQFTLESSRSKPPGHRLAEPLLDSPGRRIETLRSPVEPARCTFPEAPGPVVDTALDVRPPHPHRRPACNRARDEAPDHGDLLWVARRFQRKGGAAEGPLSRPDTKSSEKWQPRASAPWAGAQAIYPALQALSGPFQHLV